MHHHVVVSVMLAVALQSSDAVVQTSRGLVRSNLRANYFMVKDLFRQAYAGKRMPIFDNVIDLVDAATRSPTRSARRSRRPTIP